MIRTQVYLPKNLYSQIDLIAKREKKPKAEIIREALEQVVASKQETIGNALEKISRHAVPGLPEDLSTNIDKYLYEE